MADFLFAGVFLGLAAGFSPGPLLALVVTETLQYGWHAGVRVALAPVITDAPIIAAIFFALRTMAHGPVLAGVTLCGAVFVAYLGISTIRAGSRLPTTTAASPRSLRKAVIVNALSPHPYVFWASVGGPLLLRATETRLSWGLAFLGGFYGLLVGAKMFLALLAGRSRTFFQGRVYAWTLRLLGFLLLVFSFCLLGEAVSLLRAAG